MPSRCNNDGGPDHRYSAMSIGRALNCSEYLCTENGEEKTSTAVQHDVQRTALSTDSASSNVLGNNSMGLTNHNCTAALAILPTTLYQQPYTLTIAAILRFSWMRILTLDLLSRSAAFSLACCSLTCEYTKTNGASFFGITRQTSPDVFHHICPVGWEATI